MVTVDPKFTFVESHTKVIFQSVSFVISNSNGTQTVYRLCHHQNENSKSSDSLIMSLEKIYQICVGVKTLRSLRC